MMRSCRLTFCLWLGAALLATLLPARAHAQLDRSRAWELSAAATRGSPFYLYDEWITRAPEVNPYTGGSVPAIRSRYSEYAEAPLGVSGRLTYRHGRRQWVALRGAYMSSRSTARYFGGDAEESFGRTVTSKEIGVVGGIALFGSARILNPHLYVGPVWSSWRVQNRGTGRDVLASTYTAEGQVVPQMEWGDRAWSSVGGMYGVELHLRLTDALTASVGYEQRYAPVDVHKLARADQADIRDATRQSVTLGYRSYSAYPASFSLGVTWTTRRTQARDVGAEALAAARARPAADTAVSWSATLAPEVRGALERADTAAAIAHLERQLAAEPANLAVVGALGVLLAETATAVESDFLGRMRAERLLLQALRPNPRNPRYLLALGVLMEKRGYTVDTRRVMGRALSSSAEQPGALTPEELAEAFYRRGQALERTVLDYEGLRMLTDATTGLHSPSCEQAGPFCSNWERPGSFYEVMHALQDVSDLADEKRGEMLLEYDRVLQLVPAHPQANRGILAAHARNADWPAFLRQARLYADAAPDEPWASIFLTAGRYWNGQPVSDSLARATIAALHEQDRRIFDDISPLLSTQERRTLAGADTTSPAQRAEYWRAADPLLLTESNEREMEHYARVALAEILFGEPQAGRRGWESERGEIMVRYGRPRESWQVATKGDTRFIFWNYDRNQPSFIFSKSLGRMTVRHAGASATVAEQAQKLRPTTFTPVFRHVGGMPHQLARFRRPDGNFDIEIFATVPADSLRLAASDSVRTGAFLLRAQDNVQLGSDRRSSPASDPRRAYRFVAPAGIYSYALEAMRADAAAAATTRERLVVGAYSASQLQLSDVMVARYVEPRTGDPRTHRDLDYEGMACLRVPEDRMLSLIFEVYGLSVTDATASYRVEIETGETPPANLALKLLRGVRDVVTRADRGGRLSFTREIGTQDGRAVEWFDLELPARAPDDPQVKITVTDLATGGSAATTRQLSSQGCGPAH